MTIYTDIDGVLLNLDQAMCCVLHALTGRRFNHKWCYSFEEAYGLPDSLMRVAWPELWRREISSYPSAARFVSKLRKDHKVYGLSFRPGDNAKESSRHDLARQGIWFDGLIYVENPRYKFTHLANHAHLYIDDHQGQAATAAAMDIKTFLITRPWNRDCRDFGSYKRVRSFAEILREVQK